MRRTLLSLLLTVLAMLVLLVFSMHWWSRACLSLEVHRFSWQCELGLPLVALSFAIPGFVYGATLARSPWLEGFAATLFASVVASAMFYFEPLFNGTTFTNATAALFYAVLPGLLGVLAGFELRRFIGRNAA